MCRQVCRRSEMEGLALFTSKKTARSAVPLQELETLSCQLKKSLQKIQESIDLSTTEATELRTELDSKEEKILRNFDVENLENPEELCHQREPHEMQHSLRSEEKYLLPFSKKKDNFKET